MKNLIKEIISILILGIDTLILFPNSKKLSSYEICCIKLDALGDFIIWLEISSKISEAFKDKRKILICNKIVYQLAKKINYFDFVLPVDVKKFKRNIFYRIFIFQKVKSLNVKLVLQSTYSRDALTGDSIIRGIISKNKIGFQGDFKNQSKLLKFFSDRWYTNLLKFNGTKFHESEINLYFLNSLKLKYDKNNKDYKLNNFEKFQKFDLDIYNEYVVVFPGASDHSRAWSVNKFIYLINNIIRKYKYKILICGSIQDRIISNKIQKKIYNNYDIYDLCGKTTIEELFQIIKNSKLVIGNDSASVHIACLLDIPSICISGGNNFGRFVPYPNFLLKKNIPEVIYSEKCFNNGWRCSKSHNCINEVEDDKVFEACKKYLNDDLFNK